MNQLVLSLPLPHRTVPHNGGKLLAPQSNLPHVVLPALARPGNYQGSWRNRIIRGRPFCSRLSWLRMITYERSTLDEW